MQFQKSKPGPRATSCLTCRQRRKKCDLSRPFCDRCIKGQFRCLGYDDDVDVCKLYGASNRSELRRILPGLPASGPRQPAVVVPVAEPECHSSEPQNTPTIELTQDRLSSGFPPMFDDTEHSILGAGLLDLATRTESVSRVDNQGDLPASASEPCFNSLWPQDISFDITPTRSYVRLTSPAGNDIRIHPDLLDAIGRAMRVLCGPIPRSVDSRPLAREGYLTCVLTQYVTRRVRMFFQPPPSPFRHTLATRLKRSQPTKWVMYLGAKLFQTLVEDPRDTAIQPYMHWIDKFDQRVARNMESDPPIQEVEDRLMVLLELVFLKFVVFDCRGGCSLFQRSLPLFLYLVSIDSSLYVEHRGNLVVSFFRALGAPQYEIRRFVMCDTTTALILGVSPLVEYGYEYDAVSIEGQPPLEWVYGSPVELLGCIAQVNAWRSGTYNLVNSWQNLEKHVLGWQPARTHWEEDEGSATGSVARLAVQESWRHVSLIYIYMGMCRVSSHDPRVKSSVRQIIKLLEIVSQSSSLDVHMFIHCVVAGLAARYEKHRSILRAKLISFQNERIWFLPGTDFIKVLEHLWHSAGKNGNPVMWDDYIRSRFTIVPI